MAAPSWGLADNLGGTASFLNPAGRGATTSTIESKTNFFAACALGPKKSRPRPRRLHRGRSTMVWADPDHPRRRQARRPSVTQTQLVMPGRN